MGSFATNIPEEDDELDTGPAVTPGMDSDLMATITKRQQDRQKHIAAIYEAAEARLRAQPTGPSEQEKWLALAAALGKPTRTGTFGETVGNASEALLGHQQAVTKSQRDRDAALEELRMGQAKAELSGDDNLDKLALAYAKPTRLAFNPVTGAAQNPYTGEEVKPPTGMGPSDVTHPTIVPGSDPRVGGDPKKMYTIYPARMGKAPSLVEGQPSTETETITTPEGTILQRRKGSSDPFTPAPIVGGDVATEDESGKQLARSFGLPYQPPRVPVGMNKKAHDTYMAKRANDGQNRLTDVQEEVGNARKLLATADQFMALSARTKTGPAYQYMPAITRPTDINEMEGLQQNLIPTLPRTPGAISNFEAVGLGKGTFSPFSSQQTNAARYNRAKAYNQLNAEYYDFLDSWSQVHGGSIDGADAVWNRYLREQPIFDPKHADIAAPNTKRVSWKAWGKKTFYGGGGATPTHKPAPAAAKPRIKIISVEPIQ